MTLDLYPSYYGIYNISYFGGQDGYIDLTVIGGTPPYTYSWSYNHETNEDIWELAAGYYRVTVIDNVGNQAIGEITLTQPAETEPPPAPCNTTITNPAWSPSLIGDPLMLWTCPSIKVSIGSWQLPPTGIRFSVNGNSFLNGNVYVGINPANVTLAGGASPYKLLVGGKLGANEIWCAPGSPWPDYVFHKDYQLKTLDELETFISKEKHLPGLPAAAEIKNQDKINMGEMLVKILEKTEENTLYILQLKRENEQLQDENRKLYNLLTK